MKTIWVILRFYEFSHISSFGRLCHSIHSDWLFDAQLTISLLMHKTNLKDAEKRIALTHNHSHSTFTVWKMNGKKSNKTNSIFLLTNLTYWINVWVREIKGDRKKKLYTYEWPKIVEHQKINSLRREMQFACTKCSLRHTNKGEIE